MKPIVDRHAETATERESFLDRAAAAAIATPAAVTLMLAAGTRRIVADISKKTD